MWNSHEHTLISSSLLIGLQRPLTETVSGERSTELLRMLDVESKMTVTTRFIKCHRGFLGSVGGAPLGSG